MNRICPDDILLGEYLTGILCKDDIHRVEEHLAKCPHCRKVLYEAGLSLRASAFRMMINKCARAFVKYRWLLLSVCSLAISFRLRKYFMQFMVLAVIAGIRWTIDPGVSRTLVNIFPPAGTRSEKKSDRPFRRKKP